MTDLPRLHASAMRLILSLREGLERLEAAEVRGVSCAFMHPEHLPPTTASRLQLIAICDLCSMDCAQETLKHLQETYSRSWGSCRCEQLVW